MRTEPKHSSATVLPSADAVSCAWIYFLLMFASAGHAQILAAAHRLEARKGASGSDALLSSSEPKTL